MLISTERQQKFLLIIFSLPLQIIPLPSGCCSSNSRSLQKCLLLIFLIYVSSGAHSKSSSSSSCPTTLTLSNIWHWKLLLIVQRVNIVWGDEIIVEGTKLTNNFKVDGKHPHPHFSLAQLIHTLLIIKILKF